MTLSEILLWQELKQRQLGYKFSRQTPIDNFIDDFYSKDLMLAIEIDGDSHHHDQQPEKDAARQAKLESLGVVFLRFDDLDVKKKMNWVMMKLWIGSKTMNPPLTPPRRGFKSV